MSVFALAAGGTAGHINPALALANELRDRGHEVRFYGTKRGMEATLVPQDGFDFEGLDVSGFDRSRPWTGVTAVLKMRRAKKALMEEFARGGKPAAAVGFGAYVCFPLAAAAAKAGVPLVLHEQNSVPGMANKALAKDAALLALTYPVSEAKFAGKLGQGTQVQVLGNPVRASVLAPTRAQGRDKLGIPQDARVLLIFGGSLGAAHLNMAACELRDAILSRPDVYVVHAAGKKDYEATQANLALTDEQAARWRLLPYIDDMGSCLAAADLVLSRAGASSIAEIAARGVPSVLVPYPYATENHQAVNALLLKDVGGAVVVDDDKLDDEAFKRDFLALLDDAPRIADMRRRVESLGYSGATARLADAVEAVARV